MLLLALNMARESVFSCASFRLSVVLLSLLHDFYIAGIVDKGFGDPGTHVHLWLG
jgi:hypothetical protein